MRLRRPEIPIVPYVWTVSLAFYGMSVWISGFRFFSWASLAMGVAETALVLSLFVFSRRLTRLWIGVGALLAAFGGVVIRNLGMEVTPQVFEAVFQTNATEAREFLTLEVVGSFFLYAAPVLGLMAFPRLTSMGRWKTLKSFTVSLGLAIGLVLVPHGISRLDSSIAHKVEIRSYLLPLATVINAGEFYRKRGTLQIVPLSERRAIEKEFRFDWKPRSERPPVFVLFLGESQRGDRLSLNGFERKTTPGLEKEERLVTYPQVSSCSTRTVFSVPCLLSLSGEEGFSLPVRETSLISVVRSLGFETFWLSMQPNTAIPNCMEAEHCLLERDLIQELEAAGRPVSPHDERLVEALDWVMSKRAVERPTLIVLHGLGSHFGYTERYPRERAEYQVFGKVCSDGFYRCDGEELRNAYDHSLLYFDQVLTQVFQRLEGESAAVLMTSDHGESLGEKGIFAHGKPNFLAPREQRSVPLIFWASEQFSRERSLDSVFEKRIRPESASHDFVFHSVLGCLGVKSDQIRVDRNLCR